jgi:hypothetical protein
VPHGPGAHDAPVGDELLGVLLTQRRGAQRDGPEGPEIVLRLDGAQGPHDVRAVRERARVQLACETLTNEVEGGHGITGARPSARRALPAGFFEEVRTGFEPAYDGFANRCLTAWLPHRFVFIFQYLRSR